MLRTSRLTLLCCLLAVLAGCAPSEPPVKPKGSGGSGAGGAGTTPGGTGTVDNATDGGQGETGISGAKKLRLAVIPKGTTHEFWKSVHAGSQMAAKELGNVEIIWKGPILENDTDGQIKVVEDFVTAKVDGIVLAPNDSQSLVPAVRYAKEAGVPTVIFDSGLDDSTIIVSYVATDNRAGGAKAGQRLAEVLEQKGNVVLLRYKQGSESTEQREAGFLEEIAKHPGIKVLSSDQYAGTTPEESLSSAQRIITTYGDQLNGIFAVCEPNATGVLGALRDAKLTGKVKFVGFDPSQDMVTALANNEMQGIVLQDPVRMGYEAVKTMVAHLQGQEVEKQIGTGEEVATPENMKEPKMDKLLNPVRVEN